MVNLKVLGEGDNEDILKNWTLLQDDQEKYIFWNILVTWLTLKAKKMHPCWDRLLFMKLNMNGFKKQALKYFKLLLSKKKKLRIVIEYHTYVRALW